MCGAPVIIAVVCLCFNFHLGILLGLSFLRRHSMVEVGIHGSLGDIDLLLEFCHLEFVLQGARDSDGKELE